MSAPVALRRILMAFMFALIAWSDMADMTLGQEAAQLPVADAFSPPLGFRDGLDYVPRTESFDGALVEDTEYGAMNPDLVGSTCFGRPWQTIYHAGEDLYRADGASAAGAEVTAVAAGRVVYANPFINYPGRVLIVEHLLPSGETVYSVYAHLDDSSIEVVAGDTVERGQRLGTILYLRYSGRYAQYHPTGDDSHLHFEIRRFYDGSRIYAAYPACNGIVPGRGYTYPEHPDDFPTSGQGYTDPSLFIEDRLATATSTQTRLLAPTSTATLQPTQTPTRKPTSTLTPTPQLTLTLTPAACLLLPLVLATM